MIIRYTLGENLNDMKTLLFVIIFVLAMSCKKDIGDNPVIIGKTYTAFTSQKSVDGIPLYVAYRFITESMALELSIDSTTTIHSQIEVEYVNCYPEIAIRNADYEKGFWVGAFYDEKHLMIHNLKMTLLN